MLEKAVKAHFLWIRELRAIEPPNESIGRGLPQVVTEMIDLLNRYKLYIDLEVIFDSPGNFLYRQKGQLKLDNTIIEEFLPHLIEITIPQLSAGYKIGPTSCFSSIYFESSLGRIKAGGGIQLKKKDQDFAISKRLYIKTAHTQDFSDAVSKETYLGYITAECKTNLDKTMFQEATATAHDVKPAVPGAKYFLLCEWLDMTPISTAPTDIDEVLIMRKAKRVSSNVRKNFSSVQGRTQAREDYACFLKENPFRPEVFIRFVNHIIGVLVDEDPSEEDVLDKGFF